MHQAITDQNDIREPPQSQDLTKPVWDTLNSDVSKSATTDFDIYKNALPHAQGTSSTVYVCPDPQQSSPALLALKLTTPSTDPAPHDSVREVRLLKHLQPCPNVIALISSFRFREHLVLVFPFLPLPLSDLLHSPACPPLPPARKKSILADVFAGLAFIHSKGILHRDIKPSNILLSDPLQGPATIIDFGTAWRATDPASEAESAKVLDIGTTSYRAPELLFGGQNYGTGVDLWAAGCVAAEVIASNDLRAVWEKRGRGRQEFDGSGNDDAVGAGALFESGDLGSELQLVKSIFETLGTPTEETWPVSFVADVFVNVVAYDVG